jgi:hypothetical protein
MGDREGVGAVWGSLGMFGNLLKRFGVLWGRLEWLGGSLGTVEANCGSVGK